jgi:predicted glycogen debranching enzyme
MICEPSKGPSRRILGADLTHRLDHEWLVTNGLGGYASGTICGVATRRYHGLLIAAQPAPLGRLMMWNHLLEQFRFPDKTVAAIGGMYRVGSAELRGQEILREFRLVMGLPVWRFEAQGHVIEKRLVMPYRHNTVHLIYTLLDGPGPVRLKLRPSVHFRDHDAFVSTAMRDPYTLTSTDGRYELRGESPDYPALRFALDGENRAFKLDGVHHPDVLYPIEENRGYDGVGRLYSPGVFRAELTRDRAVTVTASTESWERATALAPPLAVTAECERRERLIAASDPAVRTGFGAELVLAADQFVITPVGRTPDTARAEATGDEARTVIAGYHWFTDWGRDTMISLEGLTLVTGRTAEAGYILRTFAHHVRDGLIPNFFPDGENRGLYHTADATLWFFHALSRYLNATGDLSTLRVLLPTLREIIDRHREGTLFGIGEDRDDGLLRQGQDGYQLTWMDAKVGDWVVTPRRGKAVEINALWYNALRLLAGWLRQEKEDGADDLDAIADKTYRSFNRRFWNPKNNSLFDVVDGERGDDPACRPNQIFAVSLPHAVLERSRWDAVVDCVERRLLTPAGLRSLAPGEPEYKEKYSGDLRARDAAYHQGTVWAWLIGPFLDAWVKVHPDRRTDARSFLSGFADHLSDACIGTISEVFDAEAPFTPRACVAQAWSVAEVLRGLRNLSNVAA